MCKNFTYGLDCLSGHARCSDIGCPMESYLFDSADDVRTSMHTTEIAIPHFPLDGSSCSHPRGVRQHYSVRCLLQESSGAHQVSNPARTTSKRSGIFDSPRITKNSLAPNFRFSRNSRKRCLEANLALCWPSKVPNARTAVSADQSLMRNGLS